MCVTAPAIAEKAVEAEGLHLVRHFPLSEYYSAFDLAVVAAGYNSFHESLRLGVPTLLVPNSHTSLDDQASRAGHAHRQGWALTAPTLTDGRADRLIGDLLERGTELADRARAADPGNGARDAAGLIDSLAGARA